MTVIGAFVVAPVLTVCCVLVMAITENIEEKNSWYLHYIKRAHTSSDIAGKYIVLEIILKIHILTV